MGIAETMGKAKARQIFGKYGYKATLHPIKRRR